MIYTKFFLNQILLLMISLILIMDSFSTHLDNIKHDEYINVNTSVSNESSSINMNTTSTSLPTFSANNAFTTVSTKSLVDQLNSYRNTEILRRIDQCDLSLKLNDICEIYSIDNHTNLLVRQPFVRFQTLGNIYDSLINRTMVTKLTNSCSIAEWCLGNLTQDDIDFAYSVIRKRGESFCALEQCHSRLLTFINSCSSSINQNISNPTLKLSSMLCSLYHVQEQWNSNECIEEIVYFLHIFYAYWPQFQRCYDDTSIDFDSCSFDCPSLDDVFDRLEYQCNGNISQISFLSSYQSMKSKRICRSRNLSQRFPFINSMDKILELNLSWNRSKINLLYAIFFLSIFVCFILSLSLCLHSKIQRKHRRFDDNYEYTRIHNSSFELGSNTEITDENLTIDDESQFHYASEQERLLQVQL
ncbi:hypothetical protein I4U23_026752 [Adineta vaga]|nr:hypothetical protein I4U23_026752 [Adineta vaga]